MFYTFSSKNGPQMVPRRPQDGPRMNLAFGAVFEPIFGPIWGPFWDHVFVILGVDFWIIFESHILRGNEDILDNFTALRCLLDAS